MSSVVTRGLGLALGVFFVFGAAMFVAPVAHAQWTQSDACVWPTDVPPLFYGAFGGDPHCESLCKKTASYCRKFARDGASCWNNSNKGIYGIYKKDECANLSEPDRSDCFAFAKAGQGFIKDSISSALEDALGSCDAYQNTCIMGCTIL